MVWLVSGVYLVPSEEERTEMMSDREDDGGFPKESIEVTVDLRFSIADRLSLNSCKENNTNFCRLQ